MAFKTDKTINEYGAVLNIANFLCLRFFCQSSLLITLTFTHQTITSFGINKSLMLCTMRVISY